MTRNRKRKGVDKAALKQKLVRIAGYTPEQVNAMSLQELNTAWARYLLFKETGK